ncbi:unnamed protein product [Thlaspi arvense]|uniref:FBD domain-containing protein n=1 Tax=Thlaspi arvense TaxID=13288 RepID=A0AAU9SSZ9_THLAR|nr:unnamed protein product [Thlaspi arvense]
MMLINDYAIIEPRLQLPNVSCMAVTICEADLKGLPTFLRSCPKLKYLIVGLDVYEEMPSEEIDRITFSSIVPECLLSSLKFVDIKTDISRCAECAPEMKLVKYFIENAAILKKVTLHVNHSSVDDDIDIAKELLKIPRRSATCFQI